MKALRVFIGPVQGFIASGRRTRDYWAGSFLLSRLAGEAMAHVMDKGGDQAITIPILGDGSEPTIAAIRAAAAEGYSPDRLSDWSGPLTGTLVNHFRAEVPDDFDIKAMADAVRDRFDAIADKVRDRFVKKALDKLSDDAKSDEIRKRWKAQTDGRYFEILAVLGDDDPEGWPAEARWLDRRKTYRAHFPHIVDQRKDSTQPDRCPVHPEFTELGGYSRTRERAAQDDFWQTMRETIGGEVYGRVERTAEGSEGEAGQTFLNTLELREGERPSGFALVKRLFPLLRPKELVECIGWVPDHMFGFRQKGDTFESKSAQHALRNWPSTAFVAAIPWIVRVGKEAQSSAKNYAKAQYEELGAHPILEEERPQFHRVHGIDLLGKSGLPLFAVLDGTLHFERGLEKHRFKPAGDTDDARKAANERAERLSRTFRAFRDEITGPKSDGAAVASHPPSTHYAMLEMDGDDMGPNFSESADLAKETSENLLKFANAVPEIVRHHDGVLIYAGADDVNAMLPIETAICCALAIRRRWRKIMGVPSENEPDLPTLSGSIVFSDYQNALDDVRKRTHARLDEVAKDGAGRDALALAVMKPGGVTAEWVSTWEGQERAPVRELFAYAEAAGGGERAIASRLPYVLRDRLGPVLTALKDENLCWSPENELFDDDDVLKFLDKEMRDSGLSGGDEAALERAGQVLGVLRPLSRSKEAGKPAKIHHAKRHVGGLLIARFLGDNAIWEYFRDWKKREFRWLAEAAP